MCSLRCSACAQKTLHTAMQISKCCGPISSGLYLLLWCTLVFVWQVCGTQTALCPAQKPQGGAWSWSWVLPLGTRLCKHKTILLCRIWGRILPLIASSPLQSLEGLEKGSHLRCHNHTAAAAASQLYLEKCCSCYRCGRVYTPQKLALTCQIARNLLWWLIILSLQGGSLILCK